MRMGSSPLRFVSIVILIFTIASFRVDDGTAVGLRSLTIIQINVTHSRTLKPSLELFPNVCDAILPTSSCNSVTAMQYTFPSLACRGFPGNLSTAERLDLKWRQSKTWIVKYVDVY